MRDLYAILGVGPKCSAEELKSAHRRAAREAHPDRQGQASRFHLIQEAYAVLGNPTTRAQYDQQRRAWMRQQGAVECPSCGEGNRLTRRPAADEVVKCARCKAPLRLSLAEAAEAQHRFLIHEAARVADEVGVQLAELAADAVRAGLTRLRHRLGLVRPNQTESPEKRKP